MSQNVLLTKVTSKFATALFGVAKVIADRYGGIVSEVELPEYGLKTAILPVTSDYRIRKLTEKECGRLMGVKNEDCEKIAKNQSTSSQYHLYGDSIAVPCLMAIFASLFGVSDYENRINKLVDELKTVERRQESRKVNRREI